MTPLYAISAEHSYFFLRTLQYDVKKMQEVKQIIYIMIMEWRVFVTCLAPHYKLRHLWMLNLLSVYIWSMWLVKVWRFKERERKQLRSQEFEGSPSKSVLHATLWHNGIAMDISHLFIFASKKKEDERKNRWINHTNCLYGEKND